MTYLKNGFFIYYAGFFTATFIIGCALIIIPLILNKNIPLLLIILSSFGILLCILFLERGNKNEPNSRNIKCNKFNGK
jgi:hypothetical protein